MGSRWIQHSGIVESNRIGRFDDDRSVVYARTFGCLVYSNCHCSWNLWNFLIVIENVYFTGIGFYEKLFVDTKPPQYIYIEEGNERMKILFTLPYIPVPLTFGGAIRVSHMIKIAAEHHDVTILTFGTPEEERALRKALDMRIKVHVVSDPWVRNFRRAGQLYALFTKHSFFYKLVESKEMKSILERLLAENDFDIVQTEFSHTAAYDLPTNAVKILDTHNVEYDNFRRIYENAHTPLRRLHYYLEYKKFCNEEQAACRRYDFVFTTSKRDKIILDGDVPEIPKYVIPNGVDSSYFIPSQETPEPYSLVFTGAMSYVPNYDGVLYFLDDIFPRILQQEPKAKIYIVGSKPPGMLRRRTSDNIIVTDYVEDVRPYVYRSSVYVVPLRMGGGTRLKVLEAMAMKKPIVTTSIGCEGIEIVNGNSAIIADEPQEFANSVVQLLRNETLRKKITDNGYEIMRTQYDWKIIGEQVQTLYQTLCSKQTRNIKQRIPA